MRGFIQRTLFKIAKLISSDDSGAFQQAIFQYMGSNPRGQVFIPYGVIMNPPVGSQTAVFAQNGNESNAIGFVSDPKNRTLRDLQPGEYGISNYTSGSYAIFLNNGDIEIYSNKDIVVTKATDITVNASGVVTVNAPTVNINGDVTITGLLVNNGVTFGTHTHAQPGDSGGNTEAETNAPTAGS